MASESSSAVLDLMDDDEDSDALFVDEDAEPAPLILDHGMDIAVKVDAPLKQLSTLETYVTYRVRCTCTRWPTPPAVRRRYNHFKALHARLCAAPAHAWCGVPPLPPLHSARQQLDRYSPAFVALRTRALQAFLERVARHPLLSHSEDLRTFLTAPDDQMEKVLKSESSALSLWGLSSALYGSLDSKPAGGPRQGGGGGGQDLEVEWTRWAEYLGALRGRLGALGPLTARLHRASADTATQLINMKRVCDAWSSQGGGRAWRAVGAAGAGAGGAGAGVRRAPPPLAQRATLPLLAAHAQVLRDKIKQRDALQAAVAAGAEPSETLAVASEALRSELTQWAPRTRTDLAGQLERLAAGRVRALTQVVLSWERALELSLDAPPRPLHLFKTVSPRPPPVDTRPHEPDHDFDDLEDSSSSFEQHMPLDEPGANDREGSVQVLSDPLQSFSDVDLS